MATTEMNCLASGGVNYNANIFELMGVPDSATIDCDFAPVYIYVYISSSNQLIYEKNIYTSKVYQTGNTYWFDINSSAPITEVSGTHFTLHSTILSSMTSDSKIFVFGGY